MSTRSYIAQEVGDDRYLTIYCHCDGYLTYNGAMLLDYYDTPEKVGELLALGDISVLNEKLYPEAGKPHSFSYDERQEGVAVAYGRDRGDRGTGARIMTLAQLDDPDNWTSYVYIFTAENEWKYFNSAHSGDGLRDVKTDLENEYAEYDLCRPSGYYGFLTGEAIEYLKAEQSESEQTESEKFDISM